MEKFSVKSILLGIGIGIILTSIASIIYMAGRDPFSELSKEEIMARAEKYGMVRSDTAQQEQTGIFKADAGNGDAK